MANVPDYPSACPNTLAECRVEVYEDNDRHFHYQVRGIGLVNQKSNPTLCGLSVLDMRQGAWFTLGDARGKTHFDRGCEECRERLVF